MSALIGARTHIDTRDLVTHFESPLVNTWPLHFMTVLRFDSRYLKEERFGK